MSPAALRCLWNHNRSLFTSLGRKFSQSDSSKENEITGEIKALHTRIDAVEKEIASLGSETKTEIASLRNEMISRF